MWVGLYVVQSILLFQLVVVLLALDGRRLRLVDLLCLAILVLFVQGPDPMLFTIGLLAMPSVLVLVVLVLLVISRLKRRCRRCQGSPHA